MKGDGRRHPSSCELSYERSSGAAAALKACAWNEEAYTWSTLFPALHRLKPGSEQSIRISNFSVSWKVYVVPLFVCLEH